MLGIKGKDLFLLHVLRKRMEYPELKPAVREQARGRTVSQFFAVRKMNSD